MHNKTESNVSDNMYNGKLISTVNSKSFHLKKFLAEENYVTYGLSQKKIIPVQTSMKSVFHPVETDSCQIMVSKELYWMEFWKRSSKWKTIPLYWMTPAFFVRLVQYQVPVA